MALRTLRLRCPACGGGPVFLAFDLCFRPPVVADFSAPSAPAAGRRV